MLNLTFVAHMTRMYRRDGKCMGWKNVGREYVPGGKTTGRKMSGVENDGREYVLGVKNDGREYVREGICP